MRLLLLVLAPLSSAQDHPAEWDAQNNVCKKELAGLESICHLGFEGFEFQQYAVGNSGDVVTICYRLRPCKELKAIQNMEGGEDACKYYGSPDRRPTRTSCMRPPDAIIPPTSLLCPRRFRPTLFPRHAFAGHTLG